MIHDTAAVVIGLAAFWIIGLGPALALIRGPHRWSLAAAVAGPLGLALTAMAGMVLVRLDLPVSLWARPWLLGMVLIGLFPIVRSRATPLEPCERGFLFLLAGVTLAALVLALAPVVLGGIQYTALRYNRWDALNYLSMARYLRTHPLSWILHADPAALIAHDALWLQTAPLLASRYCTGILLAWVAALSGVPTAHIEYSQGLIYPLLAIGPMLALGRLARLGWWANALLALAMSVGFWGIVVVDLRAESQLNSIPILTWIALSIAMLEEAAPSAPAPRPTPKPWPAAFMLALGIAALVPLYAEILPMTLGGLGLFVAVRAWQTRRFWATARWVAGPAALGLLLGWLCWPGLAMHLVGQFHVATGAQVNWDQAYFPWLYKTPCRDLLVGPWGLSFFAAPGAALWRNLATGDALLLLAAAGLTALYLYSMAASFRSGKDRPAAVSVHALGLLALAQFAYLLWRHLPWAAGKGMSFGYMFILAGAAFALPELLRGRGAHDRRAFVWARHAAAVLIGAWLAVEGLVVPLYRINLVRRGQEPANYLWVGIRYMRVYDYDTRVFEQALAPFPGARLGIAVDNIWLTHYLALALGDDRAIVDFFGVRDRDKDELRRVVLGRQSLAWPPEFLILERHSPLLLRLHGTQTLAENKSFVLLRRTLESWGTGLALIAASPGERIPGQDKPCYPLGHKPLLFNLVNLERHSRPLTLEAGLTLGTPGTPGIPGTSGTSGMAGSTGPGFSSRSIIEVAAEADTRLPNILAGEFTQWKLRIPLTTEPGIQTLRLTLVSNDPAAKAWITSLRLVTPAPPAPPVPPASASAATAP